MLFAELIDVAEKLAVPVGVAVGLIILFATKSGRRSIDDGYAKGKAWREKMFGKSPATDGQSGRKPTVWEYVAIGVMIAAAVLFAMSQVR